MAAETLVREGVWQYLIFSSGGGLVGGCAAGTEQCQQHCRPYQVPSCTIGYSSGTLSHYRVLCTACRVPCTVPLGVIVCRQVLPCVVSYHQVLVASDLCPSLFGAKAGMYMLTPSLFRSKQSVHCAVCVYASAFAPPLFGSKASTPFIC